ncbi:hypothetical protein [Streptomyces edwardsiae]|uniref:Integrase n=1 Tax=Streptomyces edwardsiae TaxID=3075527 RepID=A0ABU2QF50_9ACTN|nr:hypothetical protein [Streptomyces sp. DSM 41635]MDT0403091.1 hypothetical protein [Streptomyces sp. DSM 41635]
MTFTTRARRCTYAHVMGTTLRAAADRMDDALGPDDDQGDTYGETAA